MRIRHRHLWKKQEAGALVLSDVLGLLLSDSARAVLVCCGTLYERLWTVFVPGQDSRPACSVDESMIYERQS